MSAKLSTTISGYQACGVLTGVLIDIEGSCVGGVENLVVGGVAFGVGISTEKMGGLAGMKGDCCRLRRSTRPNGSGGDSFDT